MMGHGFLVIKYQMKRKKMTNAFSKYLGPEDRIHSAIVEYLKYAQPKALYTHIANEGKRSKFERYKIKILGLKAGMPDLMFFDRTQTYNGLAIEVKANKNKVTQAQDFWLKSLEENGWRCAVVYSFEEAKLEIDAYYFKHRR